MAVKIGLKYIEIWTDSMEKAVKMAMDQGKETGCATLALGSLSYLSEVKKCHDNYLKK